MDAAAETHEYTGQNADTQRGSTELRERRGRRSGAGRGRARRRQVRGKSGMKGTGEGGEGGGRSTKGKGGGERDRGREGEEKERKKERKEKKAKGMSLHFRNTTISESTTAATPRIVPNPCKRMFWGFKVEHWGARFLSFPLLSVPFRFGVRTGLLVYALASPPPYRSWHNMGFTLGLAYRAPGRISTEREGAPHGREHTPDTRGGGNRRRCD